MSQRWGDPVEEFLFPVIDMPYFHFKPDMGLEALLTEYGLFGGTHHVAMVKGNRTDDLLKLAEWLHINTVVLT